jgi:prepilin-type N-terminal cleavage/methylation domain-containing protein
MAARAAFTLVEVLIVMAILVVVLVIAYPSIDGMYSEMRLDAGADMLKANWAEARARAIEEGRPYRFAVTSGTGSFRVAPDDPEHWGGDSQGQQTTNEPTSNRTPLVVEDHLPSNIRFQLNDGGDSGTGAGDGGAAVSGSGWTTLFVIEPDGTYNTDCRIVLSADNTRPLEIYVRGLTGSVRVRPLPMEAGR